MRNKIYKTFKKVLNKYYGKSSTESNHKDICACIHIIRKALYNDDIIRANKFIFNALYFVGVDGANVHV